MTHFSTKIFIACLALAITLCSCITLTIYSLLKRNIEHEFIHHYKTDQSILSNTFRQLEMASDLADKNAVLFLSEIEKTHGIPSNIELDQLAKKLGINGFYIIDKNGRFLRSSDIPTEQQHHSLFSYDPHYQDLILGTLDIATTPIIPSYPDDVPAKLTMIANHNKTLILESSTHLEYIEKILHQLMLSDKNIQSIGLYAPTGYELGSITANGTFHQGRRHSNAPLFIGSTITNSILTISTKIIPYYKNCFECKTKGVSLDGTYYYVLTFNVSISPLLERINTLKIQIGSIFIFFLLISIMLSKLIAKKLVARIKIINKTVNDIISSKNLESTVCVSGKDEISALAISFNEMITELRKSQQSLIKTETVKAKSEMAKQLLHDIQSPLTVINNILTDTISISDKSKLIFNSASKQLNELKKNLIALSKENELALNQTNAQEKVQSYPIFDLIKTLVLEKKYEYNNSKIIIEFHSLHAAEYGFANVHTTSLKRALSNIINNSIESIHTFGLVTISYHCNENIIQIEINDNGCGIPSHCLEQVTRPYVSFDKKNGVGLGLFYAKNCIEQFGGTLSIDSTVNTGTRVTIQLPRFHSPPYFCETLHIRQNAVVVIIDDQQATHSAWQSRFATTPNITLIHQYAISDLLNRVTSELTADIYLISYELFAKQTTQFDINNPTWITKKIIFVTRFFEETLHQLFAKRNHRLIPESYIPFIAINCIEHKKEKIIVLIDNDETMRNIWSFAAEGSGITLKTFASSDEFNDEISQCQKNTPIYVDSDLDSNLSGEVYAKTLYDDGFHYIYLTTGYPANHFNYMPWVKAIRDKTPPF